MNKGKVIPKWKAKIFYIFLAGWILCDLITLYQMRNVGIELNIWLVGKVIAIYFGVMTFLWLITFLAGKSGKEK